MSTKDTTTVKQPVAKPVIVTEDRLMDVLKGMGAEMSASINTLRDSIKADTEEIVSSKINKHDAELSRTLSEHAEAINALDLRTKGGPAAASSTKIDDLISKVTAIMDIPIVKQKLNLEGDPVAAEFSNLSEVIALGAKREVSAAMKSGIRRYLKQGHLFSDEVKHVIVDKALPDQHGI